MTLRSSLSPAPAATSAPEGRARDHRRYQDADAAAARIHAHDGRSDQGDAACPQPVIRLSTACAPGRARSSPCFPTCATPRRSARVAFLFVRVGSAAAAMGACAMLPADRQDAAAELLYTGRSMSARKASRGFFNRVRRSGAAAALEAAAELRCRPELRACHDEEDAAPGMERQPRAAIEMEGRPGDLHADAGFPARLRGVRRKQYPCSKAIDGPVWPTRLAFFEPRHAQLRASRRMVRREPRLRPRRRMPTRSAGGWSRTSAAPDSWRAAFGENLDVRSIALLREVFAYHAGLATLPSVMQGWQRTDRARRGRGLRKVSRAAARATRLPRSRCRSRRRLRRAGDVDHRAPRRRRLDAQWHQDLDLERRHRPLLRRVRRRPTRASRRSWSTPRTSMQEAHRDHGASPDGPPWRLQELESRAAGEPGQGFKKLAMRNLDIFSNTVAAAALGFSRSRFFHEAPLEGRERQNVRPGPRRLQMTQAARDMATRIDARRALPTEPAGQRT